MSGIKYHISAKHFGSHASDFTAEGMYFLNLIHIDVNFIW